ncbi:hypothetical protein EYF80_061433 [Liparis tanakae]|uniref:Uncharacterized protein n=1 Tax=Liparis tanakae TaxID=230148 RepID=A0A4Z2EI05_9TELE|nr:hypothetical protein EYF80_061433 [Liparis tanakae]
MPNVPRRFGLGIPIKNGAQWKLKTTNGSSRARRRDLKQPVVSFTGLQKEVGCECREAFRAPSEQRDFWVWCQARADNALTFLAPGGLVVSDRGGTEGAISCRRFSREEAQRETRRIHRLWKRSLIGEKPQSMKGEVTAL